MCSRGLQFWWGIAISPFALCVCVEQTALGPAYCLAGTAAVFEGDNLDCCLQPLPRTHWLFSSSFLFELHVTTRSDHYKVRMSLHRDCCTLYISDFA